MSKCSIFNSVCDCHRPDETFFMTAACLWCSLLQEAAQALIYAGMAGSKLEGIQDKVNEYLDRVQALHNAGKLAWPEMQGIYCFEYWGLSKLSCLLT